MASLPSNQTIPLAAGANPFLPPPGTNWLAAIGPSLNFLMIGSTMGSVLVAMLFALLFFSTREIWRAPIFIANILALVLGIGNAIINGYYMIHTILSPESPLASKVVLLLGSLNPTIPIFVDAILLLRIYAVFPPSQTPRLKFIAIMAFPVILTIGRIVNSTIYLVNYSRNIHSIAGVSNTSAGAASVIDTSGLPNVKVEWFLQMFDDVYSSLVFLIRLRSGSSQSPQTATQSSITFGQRLKTLFWISVSNFVFPVILSIAQITIYMSSPNYLLALYVEEVNFYFTIIGVVFATLWSTADRHARSGPTETTMSAFVVARTSVPDGSVSTRLELQEPCEGRVGRDEEKGVDAPTSPYRLELSMSRLEGPQGLTV